MRAKLLVNFIEKGLSLKLKKIDNISYLGINNKKEWLVKGSNDKNRNKCEETILHKISSKFFPLVEY